MSPDEIKKFLESFISKRERTIVVVDFGNVEKWKHGLGWRVGVRELASEENQKPCLAAGLRSKSVQANAYKRILAGRLICCQAPFYRIYPQR